MKSLRILVPTDLSEASNKAFQIADEFSKSLKATVTPLYAVTKTRYDGANAQFEAETDLKNVAEKSIDKNRLGEIIISNQKPVDAIIDNGKDFDLIIMTSHGKNGFNRFLLGSVTEKVIRLSHAPVLIVKEQMELFPLEKILLTTDFSDNAKKSYPLVMELAKKTGASVHVMFAIVYAATEPATHLEAFVRTKEKQFKADVELYFKPIEDRVTFDAPLTKKSAHEYLANHIDEHRYNLVVMSTLGHTGLDYMRMGSTTSNVVRHAQSNVLITNPMSKLNWSE
ncbi:MAG TPA: hypothetical protein DCE78_05830 [Bacteroidetes bacterium]|nr:hypothetical protein [Bacteroidota bacterium]